MPQATSADGTRMAVIASTTIGSGIGMSLVSVLPTRSNTIDRTIPLIHPIATTHATRVETTTAMSGGGAPVSFRRNEQLDGGYIYKLD